MMKSIIAKWHFLQCIILLKMQCIKKIQCYTTNSQIFYLYKMVLPSLAPPNVFNDIWIAWLVINNSGAQCWSLAGIIPDRRTGTRKAGQSFRRSEPAGAEKAIAGLLGEITRSQTLGPNRTWKRFLEAEPRVCFFFFSSPEFLHPSTADTPAIIHFSVCLHTFTPLSPSTTSSLILSETKQDLGYRDTLCRRVITVCWMFTAFRLSVILPHALPRCLSSLFGFDYTVAWQLPFCLAVINGKK